MKQIGNLAIVCARRSDVTMRVIDGSVEVIVYSLPFPDIYRASWDDDEAIERILGTINHQKEQ